MSSHNFQRRPASSTFPNTSRTLLQDPSPTTLEPPHGHEISTKRKNEADDHSMSTDFHCKYGDTSNCSSAERNQLQRERLQTYLPPIFPNDSEDDHEELWIGYKRTFSGTRKGNRRWTLDSIERYLSAVQPNFVPLKAPQLHKNLSSPALTYHPKWESIMWARLFISCCSIFSKLISICDVWLIMNCSHHILCFVICLRNVREFCDGDLVKICEVFEMRWERINSFVFIMKIKDGICWYLSK